MEEMMENITSSIPIKEENKSAALEFILKNAFKSGFGTLNKSELDLILFAAIMKFGYDGDTDLQLSKYLQITQRRISNLKEKVSVKYSLIDTKKAIKYFIEKLEFAKKSDTYIDVPIADVAVKNEVEGILDKYNLLLHSQLNQKIFRIRIDDLFELLLIFQSEEQSDIPYDDFREKVLSNLKNNTEVLKKIEMEVSSEGKIEHRFKNKLLKSGVDIGLEILKEVIPGGGIALKAVDILIKQFRS